MKQAHWDRTRPLALGSRGDTPRKGAALGARPHLLRVRARAAQPLGYLSLSGPWLVPRLPLPVRIQAAVHAARARGTLGLLASGQRAAASGSRQGPQPPVLPYGPTSGHLPGRKAASSHAPPCSAHAVGSALPIRLTPSGRTSCEPPNRVASGARGRGLGSGRRWIR